MCFYFGVFPVIVCVCLYVLHVIVFFFFKQKTAYEMRISDWSSDVCSSDLRAARRRGGADRGADRAAARFAFRLYGKPPRPERPFHRRHPVGRRHHAELSGRDRGDAGHGAALSEARRFRERSEEHTSELQSLMRNSYAVFCLQKKTNK